MSTKLGRGLGSLLGSQKVDEEFEHAAVKSGRVTELPIAVIKPSVHQSRTVFDEGSLQELAASIKEHGILQPLLVTREEGGEYMLIAGERRLRAAKIAGLHSMPVVVREAGELERLLLGMIENLQRQDLGPMELAYAYKKLIDDFGLTSGQVAERVGKSMSVVTNHLRLLNLSDEIKQALSSGKITEKHGRALLTVRDENQREQIFKQVIREGWRPSETEERTRIYVKSHLRKKIKPDRVEKEERLRTALGTRVVISERGGRGKIEIHFSSDEELDELVRRIAG